MSFTKQSSSRHECRHRRVVICKVACILGIITFRFIVAIIRSMVTEIGRYESFSEAVFMWSYRYAYFAPLEACLSTLCVLLLFREVRQLRIHKRTFATWKFLLVVLPLLITVTYSCYWFWIEHPRIVNKQYRFMIRSRPNYAPWDAEARPWRNN